MDKKFPVVIIEDTAKYKKGMIVESYKQVEDGITISSDFVSESKYVVLTEALTKEDEKKIRELIRNGLKQMFWNLYTKSGVLIGNN